MEKQEINEATPLDEILRLLPQNELDELSALGDSRDDCRWKIGDVARAWIDDRRLPVLQICKIIGHKVDYGHERIRQLLYTSRYYAEHKDLREKYGVLRYSIFEHARQCSEPETVLKAALEGRLSPSQVKFTSPAMMDELKDILTRIPKRNEQEAQVIVKTAIAKLKELAE